MSDIVDQIEREQQEAIRKLNGEDLKSETKVETKPPAETKPPETETEGDDWILPGEAEKKVETETKDETETETETEVETETETKVETEEQKPVVKKETKPEEKKSDTPAGYVKKEIADKLEVEVAYYRNMINAMNNDPQYLIKLAPEAFAQKKSATEVLEEKYGKDFFENEFNEKDAYRPGTKSFNYANDARELMDQARANDPAKIVVAAMNHRKKLYDDGMEYMRKKMLEIKKDVPYINEAEFAAEVNALADVSGNPLKAVAELAAERIRRKNDVKIKETRLANDKTVLKEKRSEVLPTPPGAQVSSGKTKQSQPKGDFDDIDTIY